MNVDQMDSMTAKNYTSFSCFISPQRIYPSNTIWQEKKNEIKESELKISPKILLLKLLLWGSNHTFLKEGINTDPLKCEYNLATNFQGKK